MFKYGSTKPSLGPSCMYEPVLLWRERWVRMIHHGSNQCPIWWVREEQLQREEEGTSPKLAFLGASINNLDAELLNIETLSSLLRNFAGVILFFRGLVFDNLIYEKKKEEDSVL